MSVDHAQEIYEANTDLLLNHFNKIRETYKEFYKHLKPNRQVYIPETPGFMKTKKEVNQHLFKKPEVAEDTKEPSKDEITEFSQYEDSLSEVAREGVRRGENPNSLADKLSKYWDMFSNKVANIFRDLEQETILKTKAVKVIEAEKYKLRKLIEQGWDLMIELIKIYPIYIKRYHEDKYWRLYSQVISKKRVISKKIDQLDIIVTSEELKNLHEKMDNLRKEYIKSTGYETARGIIGEKCIFRQKNSPIFYEEILKYNGGAK